MARRRTSRRHALLDQRRHPHHDRRRRPRRPEGSPRRRRRMPYADVPTGVQDRAQAPGRRPGSPAWQAARRDLDREQHRRGRRKPRLVSRPAPPAARSRRATATPTPTSCATVATRRGAVRERLRPARPRPARLETCATTAWTRLCDRSISPVRPRGAISSTTTRAPVARAPPPAVRPDRPVEQVRRREHDASGARQRDDASGSSATPGCRARPVGVRRAATGPPHTTAAARARPRRAGSVEDIRRRSSCPASHPSPDSRTWQRRAEDGVPGDRPQHPHRACAWTPSPGARRSAGVDRRRERCTDPDLLQREPDEQRRRATPPPARSAARQRQRAPTDAGAL